MTVLKPMFIILAGTGAVFIVMGLVMLKYPPKQINDWYGYRTTNSKKSQERWEFAQRHSSKIMTRIGQVLAIVSFPAAQFSIERMLGAIIAIVIVVASGMFIIVNTEKALREKFGG